jgi:hypothetical protein
MPRTKDRNAIAHHAVQRVSISACQWEPETTGYEKRASTGRIDNKT